MGDSLANAIQLKSTQRINSQMPARIHDIAIEIDPRKVPFFMGTLSSTYKVRDELAALTDPQYLNIFEDPALDNIRSKLEQYLDQANEWLVLTGNLNSTVSQVAGPYFVSGRSFVSGGNVKGQKQLESTGSPVQSMVEIEPDVSDEFQRLAADWRTTRSKYSSGIEIYMHPSYQQIIGMGAIALPFIIDALRVELDHWFWALKAITRHDPVPPDEIGNLEAMRNRWLAWANENSQIWQQKSTRTLYELENSHG